MDRYLNAYNNLSKPNYIPENQFKLTLVSTSAPRIPRNVWSKTFFALASAEVSSYKFRSKGNSKRQGDAGYDWLAKMSDYPSCKKHHTTVNAIVAIWNNHHTL